MIGEIDAVAANRFEDALLIQQGASNPSGVARTLVHAINACHQENARARVDAAVRLIVHQLAHLCGVWEIDHDLDTYGKLTAECEARKAALQAARST
jgi:hypothetical protein